MHVQMRPVTNPLCIEPPCVPCAAATDGVNQLRDQHLGRPWLFLFDHAHTPHTTVGVTGEPRQSTGFGARVSLFQRQIERTQTASAHIHYCRASTHCLGHPAGCTGHSMEGAPAGGRGRSVPEHGVESAECSSTWEAGGTSSGKIAVGPSRAASEEESGTAQPLRGQPDSPGDRRPRGGIQWGWTGFYGSTRREAAAARELERQYRAMHDQELLKSYDISALYACACQDKPCGVHTKCLGSLLLCEGRYAACMLAPWPWRGSAACPHARGANCMPAMLNPDRCCPFTPSPHPQ